MKDNTILNEIEIESVKQQVVDPDYGRTFIFCHLSSSCGSIDDDQYAALEKLFD
jgi:hypothetical protein